MRIVGGKFSGTRLISPQVSSIRPTVEKVREAIFNILYHRYYGQISDMRVLDLFSGTGALGLESLSRGARFCVFVERSIPGCKVINMNIKKLKLQSKTKVLRGDAANLRFIGNILPFDLVFMDPPYSSGLGELAARSILAKGWLCKNANLILEESTKSIPYSLKGFITKEIRVFGDTSIGFFQKNEL